MSKKIYVIGGHNFSLKEYGELTGFEEEKIDQLLTRENNSEIIITGYEIFPIILVSEDAEINIRTFDWRHLKNNQVVDILVDFLIQKKTSQDTMPAYMAELTKQKLQQSETMNTNMDKRKILPLED